jgi:outer membrane protein assembly factor BamB
MLTRFVRVIALLGVASACAPPLGDDVWQVETPRPLLGGESQAFTPAIASNTIYFCGGHAYTAAAELVAVNAADGNPRWRFRVESCAASPILNDDTVVVFGEEPHSSRVVLHGLAADTGRERWRLAVGEIAAHGALQGSVFLAKPEGIVQRVDVARGLLTDVALKTDAADRWWMAGADGQLFIGAGASVWRIAADRRPVDMPRLESRLGSVSAAAIEGNRLVLQDTSNRLTVFDRSSGARLWSRRWFRLLGEPAMVGGRVFVNTFGPNRYELQAVDAASGRDLWSVLDGGFDAPTIANGRLYAAGRSSVLIIEPQTGSIVGAVRARNEVVTSPLSWSGHLLFGTIDGVLHAARLSAESSQAVTGR